MGPRKRPVASNYATYRLAAVNKRRPLRGGLRERVKAEVLGSQANGQRYVLKTRGDCQPNLLAANARSGRHPGAFRVPGWYT